MSLESFLMKIKSFGHRKLEEQIQQELIEIYGKYHQFQEKQNQDTKSDFLKMVDFLHFQTKIERRLLNLLLKKVMLHQDYDYRRDTCHRIQEMMKEFHSPWDDNLEKQPEIIDIYLEESK